MANYVIVESRDPFESRDVLEYSWMLAGNLVKQGHAVTMFLVQNGVLPTRRRSPAAARLSELAAGGVRVIADDFSLRERGIAPDGLAQGVAPSSIDALVDLLVEPGVRAFWH